jgi:hypothetical protein
MLLQTGNPLTVSRELRNLNSNQVIFQITITQSPTLLSRRRATIGIMTITITVERDGFYEVNGMRHEPSVSLYVIPAASKLRRMLKDSRDLIVCPGVYDGLSARIAMELGFKGMYMVCDAVLDALSLGFGLSLTSIDWCRNNCFTTRNGRPGSCPAS